MEIERKYRVRRLPDNLESFPSRRIEQAYLSVGPVVRVRRDGELFYLTYKSGGLMVREEYNLPLTKASYLHLLAKADGAVITKQRYRIPYEPYTVELDVFDGAYAGLILAEVEFPTEEEAERFTPPQWFGQEVTFDGRYHNSYMALHAPQSASDTDDEIKTVH